MISATPGSDERRLRQAAVSKTSRVRLKRKTKRVHAKKKAQGEMTITTTRENELAI